MAEETSLKNPSKKPHVRVCQVVNYINIKDPGDPKTPTWKIVAKLCNT